jgi:hypothetical protein
MGVGYYMPLTQWSRGEYSGANTQEDDLAVMATFVPVAPDDHGNSMASATRVFSGG